MKITSKDIAVVEMMHDLLLDMHKYDLNSNVLSNARELTKRMYESIKSEKDEVVFSLKEEINAERELNILEEANDIIFNRGQEKERQYGPIDESLRDTATIASVMTDKTISTSDVYKVLIALKLSRLKYNNKRDTFLDAIGYMAAYQKYTETIDDKSEYVISASEAKTKVRT